MSSIRFTKMHGAGNDFVVIDRLSGASLPDAALARRLADRHFGIGCDQIMVIEAAADPAHAYAYRILNADGSSAGQCGNGARCVARYLRERHDLADGALLDSPGGAVAVRFLADGAVEYLNRLLGQLGPQAAALERAARRLHARDRKSVV